MSVADRLTKLTTDITNAYTSIDNKGGTIPSDKNTDNLHTAIDSIEVIEQQTAEGESLSLVNTKAMPYSDYVVEGKSEQDGEPSPSNPSEIHSVADDVNLFNKEATISSTGYITSYTYSNGIYTIIPTGTGNPQIRLNVSIPQGTYTLNSNNYLSIATILRNNNGLLYSFENNYENQTFTINESSSELVFNLVNPNNTNPIILDFNTLKIQKGTEVTPYSPYNQGTVTIKQRGKNKLPNDLEWSYGYVTSNGSWQTDSTHKNAYSDYIYLDAGTYTISYKTATTIISISKYDINKVFVERDQTIYVPTASKNKTFTLTQNGYIRVSHYDDSGEQIIENINNEENQIEQGSQATTYEPYQANDYTIQTEPLRSLPNGVKDTIEEDGIHRRVGRVVLNGTEENWYLGQYPADNSYQFMTNKPSNMFTDTGTSVMNKLLSTYFKNEFGTNGMLVGSLLSFYPSTDLNISTPNEFKIWLSTHNTEIIYELAEEIIEPLTQNQATTMLDIIKTGSYEGTTNIYTDEDVKPTMGVGYYKKG